MSAGSHLLIQPNRTPVYSNNNSKPFQCLEADLHQDVREAEAGGMGPPVAVPHNWYHGPYDFWNAL